jgi:hypothetical protein
MAGATRSKTRNEAIKQPISPSDDELVPDAPFDESSNSTNSHNTNATLQQPQLAALSDDVSQLSEGLEPMSIRPAQRK